VSGAEPIAALPRVILRHLFIFFSILGIADQGGSAEDQNAADVDISLLRSAAEALPACCRALLWCQTEKGSEMARRFELGRIGHRGDNGRGGNTADPGDGGETPAGFIAAVPARIACSISLIRLWNRTADRLPFAWRSGLQAAGAGQHHL